jgi:DNA-binding transcriptional LysR family regulator
MEAWFGVELRHLAALVAVHEEGSFRGAAERLGYVQSVVSQRIVQLERAVGVRLVERSRGHSRVELTEAGESLMFHAERVLARLSAAQADLRARTKDPLPMVRIGASQSLATRILPRALGLLRESTPETRVDICEVLCDGDLFGLVEEGKLDAAFADLPLGSGPFKGCDLFVDPLVLLVPADSPLARRSTRPGLAEIAEQPLVVDPSWRMFSLIEAEFAAAGHRLDKRFTASTNSAAQALVGAGLGVAMIPRLAADDDDPTTEIIQLTGVLPPRTVACYWHRDRHETLPLEPFLAAVRAACAEMVRGAGDTSVVEDAPSDAIPTALGDPVPLTLSS